MARDTSKLVTIPGELHSAATGNIVSASQEIFDYDSNSYQSQLNKQLYNVSAHDSSADAKYTLEEAIAAVPASYHVGGLILTFISKEGDFEIYQLKSKDWDNDTSKWSIVPNNVVQDNPEFVEVHLDGSEHVLYGVRADGDFYFGAGVPSQVKGYVDEKSAEIDGKIEDLKEEIDSSINVNIEKIEEEISALDASTKADIARLDASVSTGFDRVDASLYALGYYEENPEFVEAHIDSSSKLLYGVKKDDGDFYFGAGVPSQIRDYVNEKGEKIDASILEIETRFYNVNAHDGSIGINYTLEEAIAAVPEEYRNGGLILTFNSDDNVVLYQCKIDSFSENINDWIQYTSKKYVDETKQNVDSSISSIKSNLKAVESKTLDITRENYIDDYESIILATDDNTTVTTIKAEKSFIEDDVIEFSNEIGNQTYAKIGSIDGSSGLFVDNIYDLDGNILFQFDSSNDILILAGKKYKMIPYIET